MKSEYKYYSNYNNHNNNNIVFSGNYRFMTTFDKKKK